MSDNSTFSLFAWGANSHGQLGVGYENEMEMKPVRLDTSLVEGEIRQISGGGGHTLILDSSGQVYTCGWNNKGQLGVGDFENRTIFAKIPAEFFQERKIISVSSGWDTSAAITEDQELYMWGSNQFGQFGMEDFRQTEIPRKIEKISCQEKIVQVTLGLRHVCILTESGTLHILGKFKRPYGERSIKIFGPISKMTTGQHHLIYLRPNKSFETVGDNKFHQCSDESLNNFTEDVSELKSGWTHSGLLTHSRKVFLWGRNSYGQLGREASDPIATPSQLNIHRNVREFHLGSEHGLCVTEDGKAFTWGWNEHGNCGNGDTENIFEPQEVSLPGKCALAGVGAGFCYCVVK
ncbi:secretion-regulating guanine nucleotide exchange factor [Sergentomyia squamirostris]